LRYLRPIVVPLPRRDFSRIMLSQAYGNGLTHIDPGGALTPGPVTVDIPPEADSMVQSYYPNQNYGSATYWGAGQSQAPNYVRSYLRFPLTGIPLGKTINYARLYFYVYSIWGTPVVIVYTDIHFVSVDTWEELTITWNNKPALSTKLISMTPISTTGWKNYDITSQVRTEYAGDGKISLCLKDYREDGAVWEGWYAYSKEYTDPTYRPFLRVEYQ